ncbi:MAG: demethoxyubiquinone hydroxylase family protein [Armatimonadota bacterium]
MPETNPFLTMVPRKMTDEELARAIRLDIQAELDAINLYQAHIDATDNEDAKKVLAHIRDDEKEHVAEFLALLRILDPAQAEDLDLGQEKLQGILAGTHKHDGAEGEPQAEDAEANSQLTVGSLIKEK